MLDIEDLKGHRSSSVDGIHVAAGRTKPGMTKRKGTYLKFPQEGQVYMAPPKKDRPIDHFFYIFDDGVTRMLNINHFLKMVFKNFL